jgi:hypothetical protein
MRTKRREFTTAQKAAIAKRATNERGQIVCEGCHLVLGKKPFDVDHIIPEGLRPDADKQDPLKLVDGQLLGRDCCHRGEGSKTSRDQTKIAKSKRVEAKNLGIRKRPTIQSRRFGETPPQNSATRPLTKTVARIQK